MASHLALQRLMGPLKAPLPPEKSTSGLLDTATWRMEKAEQTLPTTRAFGVAPLDKNFRCTPNGHYLWHSRHERAVALICPRRILTLDDFTEDALEMETIIHSITTHGVRFRVLHCKATAENDRRTSFWTHLAICLTRLHHLTRKKKH